MQRRALVLGAGGFIGSHLVKRLKRDGLWVRGADVKHPEFLATQADEFVVADLRKQPECDTVLDLHFDEIYQLAADMGGAGYVFTGENDADILHNSAVINLNVLDVARRRGCGRIFYSSSACIYPAFNQQDENSAACTEDTAYPAAPDSEYGWEKLFSERLYASFARNHGLTVRVARYHNVFGPQGAWTGGREKAPAALCRKIAEADREIEIWGDGRQTRSFLHIDECIEGTVRLMRSGYAGPVNIGSEEMVSIDGLAEMIMAIAGKRLYLRHVPGPLGVRGRNSDNRLIMRELGWSPTGSLRTGLESTYRWIESQVTRSKAPVHEAG